MVHDPVLGVPISGRDAAAEFLSTPRRNLHVPERRCNRCSIARPVEEFTLKGKGAKRRGICRYCEAEQKRLLNYNLNDTTYRAILLAQNNVCAICEGPFDSAPHVDHDHLCCPGPKSCGRCIRGLLCKLCNHAIGLFVDDPDILYAAARYLTREAEYQ